MNESRIYYTKIGEKTQAFFEYLDIKKMFVFLEHQHEQNEIKGIAYSVWVNAKNCFVTETLSDIKDFLLAHLFCQDVFINEHNGIFSAAFDLEMLLLQDKDYYADFQKSVDESQREEDRMFHYLIIDDNGAMDLYLKALMQIGATFDYAYGIAKVIKYYVHDDASITVECDRISNTPYTIEKLLKISKNQN